MVNAREHVEQRPFGRRGEPDAVGGDGRHAKRGGQRDERRVIVRLVASKMTLQLDVHPVAAEDADEPIEQAGDTMRRPSSAARPASATRPAVQPSSSSSVSAPSPFGARSFMRVISRQRFPVALSGFAENRQHEGAGWRLRLRMG
jgi:hypothetical protein